MTQIAVAAGSNTSVPLAAGSKLLLTGQGTYRIGPRGTSQRPTVDELIDLMSTIGPFNDFCTVQVWGTGSGATYEVVLPTDAADQTGRPYSVSGSGIRTDLPRNADLLVGPVQSSTITAAISTTVTASVTPTGTFRTARIQWTNNGASGTAKLNIAANCTNDVEGLVASQSALQRDYQMTMGDAILIVSPTPITRLNFSSDTAISASTHNLTVTFGA